MKTMFKLPLTTAITDATNETKISPELPFDPGSLKVDADTKKEPAIDVKNDDTSARKEIKAVKQDLENEYDKSAYFAFEPGVIDKDTNMKT